MLTITAACICSADVRTGVNKDNLLFSGQILPEVNGGLAGTPSAKVDPRAPYLAAVLDGDNAAASYYAAETLKNAAPDLDAPRLLLGDVLNALAAGEPPASCAAAVVCTWEDKLSLAAAGACRAFLLRDRSLFLLHDSADGALWSLSGSPIAGDRLLLCTDGLADAVNAQQLLSLLYGARSDPEALQQLLERARSNGAQDSVTALLLRFA